MGLAGRKACRQRGQTAAKPGPVNRLQYQCGVAGRGQHHGCSAIIHFAEQRHLAPLPDREHRAEFVDQFAGQPQRGRITRREQPRELRQMLDRLAAGISRHRLPESTAEPTRAPIRQQQVQIGLGQTLRSIVVPQRL